MLRSYAAPKDGTIYMSTVTQSAHLECPPDRADLTRLIAAVLRINRSFELTEILAASLESMGDALRCDLGCLFLFGSAQRVVELKNVCGLSPALYEQLAHVTLDYDVYARLPDAERQMRLPAELSSQVRQIFDQHDIRTVCLIPLTAREKAVGLIALAASSLTLAQPDLDLLWSIGEQIGMTVENARACAALKESEAWARTFIEKSPDGFIECSVSDGRILYVNDALCDLLETDRATILQMPIFDFIGENVVSAEASADGRQPIYPTHRQTWVKLPNGKTKKVAVSNHFVRQGQGHAIRFQSIVRDISQQDQTLESLNRRNQELAALNAIGSILSHPLELERALDQVCEQIVSIIGMDSVSLYLVDGTRQYLDLLAWRGIGEDLLGQIRRLGLDDPVTRQIAAEGNFFALDDVAAYAGTSGAGPRAAGYHAGIGVPIRRHNEPIGAIFVGSKTKMRYEQSDVDLLINIGGQIAVALENRDLYTAMQERVAELDGLAQFSAVCASQLDTRAIGNIAVEWTQKFLTVDMCSVRLVEGETQRLIASYTRNGVPLLEQLPIDHVTRSMLTQRRPVVFSDFPADPSESPIIQAALRQAKPRAGLLVPLPGHTHPIGMLSVGKNQAHVWTQREINLMRTLANQVGVALANASLYEQVRRRAEELDGLAQLSAAFVTTLDPKTISELAVTWTRKLIPAQICSVRLVKDHALQLAARYTELDNLFAEELVLDEALLQHAHNRAVYAISDRDDPQLPAAHRQILLDLHASAALLAPLPTSDRVLGFISIAYREPHAWSVYEIGLLQTIANQTANALDNALLFQRVMNEQRKVQAIFDSGLSGLFATDAAGRIVMFNRAAERITGWSRHHVEMRQWDEVFSQPNDEAAFKSLINEALQHRRNVYVPSGRKMRTRDGRVIPVAQAIAPLFDEQSNIAGAVGAFWDLTKEQLSELEHENFLTLVAHQLRSPLTTVLSALELLDRRDLPSARRKELWTLIQAEGTRLKAFADQFLDRQAAVRSALPLRFETFSVVMLARQLTKEFQARCASPRFFVRYVHPEPLAFADRQRVENVLRNLLDNAVTYAPAGKRVTVAIKAENVEQIKVTVRDQGPGIPFAAQEHIFTPFYRSTLPVDRSVYGHGLGLAIAKEMVTAMEGKIWLDSGRRGTAFHFTLRRAQ